MSKLFEDSESDGEINTISTDNAYAKSYDTWRTKEEFNKYKARHGESALDIGFDDDEEDSSDDDEEAVELTEEIEKDFYKTLAMFKKKDPSIYDDKVVFFKESYENDKLGNGKQKEKKMFPKDFERKLLLEKKVIESDDENKEVRKVNQKKDEEKNLRESIKASVDDSDEDVGSFMKAREQKGDEDMKDEEDVNAWLNGQEDKLKDSTVASYLKPLKDYWNDEKLDDAEKFLRDYLLNKRYLEKDDKDYIPTYDEIVKELSDDEEEYEKQEEFEYRYNFRHSEPDEEFIKRYPRTVGGSLRREENKRKLKRQEVKERKTKEKEEKMNELKKLRDLKRKEIEAKIEKLKEITGNTEIAFKDEDIEGDFNPDEHDKRMQALFDDEYYENGPEEDVKPPIDLDDEEALELQPETFDDWTGPDNNEEAEEPHCEDENFNMDADYDPRATQKQLVENSRRKKKRKRKSKFVEMLSKDRPKFDPMNKNYEEYVDEYYKYECEDIIEDTPCKFKYRKVTPNNFGLSVEEILLANDRELNKWCSLKKAVSIRDEVVERNEQSIYERKGQNINLKRKIIPSLFVEKKIKEEDTSESSQPEEKRNIEDTSNVTEDIPESKKRKLVDEKLNENQKISSNENSVGDQVLSKKKKKKKVLQTEVEGNNHETTSEDIFNAEVDISKSKKKKFDEQNGIENQTIDNDENSHSVQVSPKKKKKKSTQKDEETRGSKNNEMTNETTSNTADDIPKSKKKKFDEQNGIENQTIDNNENSHSVQVSPKKKKKKSTQKDAETRGSENNEMTNETTSNTADDIPKSKKRKLSEVIMENPTIVNNENSVDDQGPSKKKRKKKKKKIASEDVAVQESKNNETDVKEDIERNNSKLVNGSSNKKRRRKNKNKGATDKNEGISKKKRKLLDIGISDSALAGYGWNPKKFKNKLIYGNKEDQNK